MARLNRAELIGHLGKDPELKTTAGGASVCTFSLATDESYKDKDGNQQNKTEWHKIVVWGKQAENAAQYLKKGSLVFLEGKLQTRSWEKDGQKHYMTEIVVFNFQMLGGKKDGVPVDDDKPAFPSDEPAKPTQGGEDLPF